MQPSNLLMGLCVELGRRKGEKERERVCARRAYYMMKFFPPPPVPTGPECDVEQKAQD